MLPGDFSQRMNVHSCWDRGIQTGTVQPLAIQYYEAMLSILLKKSIGAGLTFNSPEFSLRYKDLEPYPFAVHTALLYGESGNRQDLP